MHRLGRLEWVLSCLPLIGAVPTGHAGVVFGRARVLRPPHDTVARRGMEGGVFVSHAGPELRMRVAPPFRYLGHFEIDLKDITHVDRHVFAETTSRRVTRLIILQFERLLPTSTEVYRYDITNPIALAGTPYRHNLYVFDAGADAREDAGAETGTHGSLLPERGLELPDEEIVLRFARIVGDDRRHELIIFYDEMFDHRHTLAEVGQDGRSRQEFAVFGDSVTRRSLQSFKVLP